LRLGPAWVRLTLPDADWAYVIFGLSDYSNRGRFSLLHRVDGSWRDASGSKPYCTSLPPNLAHQLFLSKTSNIRPEDFFAPPGETRC
jgi:hypothetical protein